MMVDKTVRVQLETDEVEVLKNVCELARRHFDARLTKTPAPEGHGGCDHTVDEFDIPQTQRIRDLITQVFDL